MAEREFKKALFGPCFFRKDYCSSEISNFIFERGDANTSSINKPATEKEKLYL